MTISVYNQQFIDKANQGLDKLAQLKQRIASEKKSTSGNPTNQNQHPPAIDYLLPKSEVIKQSGYSSPSIYRLMKLRKFPHPVKTGGGGVRWRQSDITAWLQSLPTTDQLK